MTKWLPLLSSKLGLKVYLSVVTTFVLAQLLSLLPLQLFILDWIVSFLPYGIIVTIVALASTLLIRYHTKPNRFTIITILITTLLLVTQVYLLIDFSWTRQSKAEIVEQSRGVVFSFHNKYYLNKKYSEIASETVKLNPDVLSFAEFRVADKQILSENKEYPYSLFSKHPNISKQTELAIYSKYPLTKVDYQIPGLPSLIAEVDINGQKYTTIVIHTSAPISQGFLLARNEQMNSLNKYLSQINLENPSRKVVLLGDFNLSPWSQVYRNFIQNQDDNNRLINVFQGHGLISTWRFRGPISAHIDHILVSPSVQIADRGVGDFSGSDHRLVWVKLL